MSDENEPPWAGLLIQLVHQLGGSATVDVSDKALVPIGAWLSLEVKGDEMRIAVMLPVEGETNGKN